MGLTHLRMFLFPVAVQANFFHTFDTMNKLTMSQIRQKSGLYYAVGIAVFSSFFVVIAVIAQLIASNS